MLDIKDIVNNEVHADDKSFPIIKELPSWFRLDNYRNASQLDLEGWITQIYFRLLVEDFYLRFICTGVMSDYHLPERKDDIQANQSIRLLSSEDAILITEELKSYLHAPADVWQSRSFFHSQFPTPAQGEDKSSAKDLLSWFKHDSGIGEKDRHLPLFNKAPYAMLAQFVHVDLAAPDAILIDSFKQWLKQKRATSSFQGCSFSKATLRRWAINQILPYIDLTYWAKHNKVQIPCWLMGEALFPGNIIGSKTDRVRKTTEKNAKEVMTGMCLKKMAAQLEYETGKSLDLDCFFSNPDKLLAKMETDFLKLSI